MMYNICPECGASLDPGGECDYFKIEKASSERAEETISMKNSNGKINCVYDSTKEEKCQALFLRGGVNSECQRGKASIRSEGRGDIFAARQNARGL